MEPDSPGESIESIGVVNSPRKEKRDDEWGDVASTIELDADRFEPAAVSGLDDFSHAEVVFFMHRVHKANIEWGARHPRNNSDWPEVGIFAQRAKGRPNRIGLSRCQITNVEKLTIHVVGLDAIDGTPILGLEPFMKEFGPKGEVIQPSWASELMNRYY